MLIRTGKISEALCICFGLGQFCDFRRIPFGLRVQINCRCLKRFWKSCGQRAWNCSHPTHNTQVRRDRESIQIEGDSARSFTVFICMCSIHICHLSKMVDGEHHLQDLFPMEFSGRHFDGMTHSCTDMCSQFTHRVMI